MAPLSGDYRLLNAYKTRGLPEPSEDIQSKLGLLERNGEGDWKDIVKWRF